MNNKTDFGFQHVKPEEKTQKVSQVFSSVARRYDLMNDLMSLGIHRLWKRSAIALAQIRPEQKVLDLAGGTGDLSKIFSRQAGAKGQVILADLNHAMISIGRDELMNEGVANNITYIQTQAEKLPFADNYFNCVMIGFGLRNFTDKAQALREIYRVIKPGGRLVVLEFSKPTSKFLQKIYDLYSFKLLPKLGKLVANDSESYQYLVESIRMHPDQENLRQLIEEQNFEDCEYYNLTGGIVAIHRAYKY